MKKTRHRKLTAKQEKFARLVAEGKTQSEAYRLAYNCVNNKPDTIWSRASELANHSGVSARIEELRRQFTQNLDIASQITVERQLEYCQKAIQECLQSGDWANLFKGLDMQNKLLGLYAPIKNETTTKLQAYIIQTNLPIEPLEDTKDAKDKD